ncbi:MAG TPA: serine hydrolase domain-containing protein [Candidatus Solibacter sp.]|nr:serine hydrolase domain-containing protein [Candidatus Solibacter sp.]
MKLRLLAVVILCLGNCVAQKASDFETLLSPYVTTDNFSGSALIEKSGKVVFGKSYGLANRDARIPNTKNTRFHVASVSMQFTAAAILRLIDQGSLTLSTHVSEIVPDISGGDKITIRDLLLQRSGLTDINGLSDYSDVLAHHQTPTTLVAKIEDQPLLFDPGSKYLHEEHSAYNLLALIIETKTGLSFAAAMKKLVFLPAQLSDSFIDDDAFSSGRNVAEGYQPRGVTGIEPAATIHWSAKAGNASVVISSADAAKWIRTLFHSAFLKDPTRSNILEITPRVGYGWMRANSDRFHQTIYYMNGRAPGFSSFVMYLPKDDVSIVVLSNIYSSATTTIGNDLAAVALGLPYEAFRAGTLSAEAIKRSTGTFHFGADFYQPNADLVLFDEGSKDHSALFLRWPSGDTTPLIPLTPDHFVDRAYWEQVAIERDTTGAPVVLHYGTFQGTFQEVRK